MVEYTGSKQNINVNRLALWKSPIELLELFCSLRNFFLLEALSENLGSRQFFLFLRRETERLYHAPES